MKYCPRCKTEKKLFDFYKNKLQSDGHSIYCKLCHSINSQEYYQRKLNPVSETKKSDLKFNGYNNESKTFSIMVKVSKTKYKLINFSLTETKTLIKILTQQIELAEQNNILFNNINLVGHK
jgi:hypothetical protein